MKKWFLVGITAMAISAASSVVLAEAKQDFTLVNKTGYTIDEVYVSPHSTNDWLDDVLGQDVLGDGENAKIKFHSANEICKYDLKVIYDDKEEVEWTDIDLCEEEKITIRWNKKSGESSATFD
ncbi:MAG: hypothetical protein Q7T96_14100 [Methylobacter sp.]|uniref:hypothetical protein n=1 Tax=Methylobacter sp. TaxID=2051955 RepID=UPI00272461FC|nr:hypothetical protein [Methylobacter sp.]MDO9270232.1 hypothetical protein [Methylobacter sp.]MDP1666348.1 hypothetical protein [Methylobacter sp.]MDP1970375.1 hypothetical protein [Methylobacter sp.]